MQVTGTHVFGVVFALLLVWKLGKTILLCGVLAAMATLAFSYWKTGTMPDIVSAIYAKVSGASRSDSSYAAAPLVRLLSSLPSREQATTFQSNVLKDLNVLQGDRGRQTVASSGQPQHVTSNAGLVASGLGGEKY